MDGDAHVHPALALGAMQYIADVHDGDELRALVDLLEGKGIPTFYRTHGFRSGTYFKLFVRVDAQYEDAILLMRDSNHEVSAPVDMEKYREASKDETLSNLRSLDRIIALIVPVTIALVLIFLARYIAALNSAQ